MFEAARLRELENRFDGPIPRPLPDAIRTPETPAGHTLRSRNRLRHARWNFALTRDPRHTATAASGLIAAAHTALALMQACASRAAAAGISRLWVFDHIALPPAKSEGSGGRYVDPLTTLAWLAGLEPRIGLGTSVLTLPLRSPLETAKAIAAVQELSGNRLTLGVGLGSIESEYAAARADWKTRGRVMDERLAFLEECFASDEMDIGGGPFRFLPRPAAPPILVGGDGPHAIRRVAAHGAGWMPPKSDPAWLAERLPAYRAAWEKAGRRGVMQVVPLVSLPLEDPKAAAAVIGDLKELGVTGICHFSRYEGLAGFTADAEALAQLR